MAPSINPQEKTAAFAHKGERPSLLQMIDVHKSMGARQVLNGVNLTAAKGEITVILGRSGGGKSVLLKHLIGLLHPDKGRVLVDGQDLALLSEMELFEFRKRYGFLFQQGALFDSLTVGENVAFRLTEHTKLSKGRIRQIVADKLAQVGLKDIEDKLPGDLSGGMLKRVALARSLALDPEIILFDEPTTGLDPIMTANIIRLVTETVRHSGMTAVIISHDMELTFALADSIAFLDQGKILIQAAPGDLRQSSLPPIVKFLRGEPD